MAHDRHDLELVARTAAGDLDAGEVALARDLLATCDACAQLATDLRAIATATRDLGPAAAGAASISAPRDFRLTAADAARLRRRGFLGRADVPQRVAALARGFGGALATLGLVGLLVSAGLPALSGGSAGAATRQEFGSGRATDTASPVPALFPTTTGLHVIASGGNPPRTDDLSGSGISDGLTPWQVAAIVSIAVLVTGLALLVLGWAQQRTGR